MMFLRRLRALASRALVVNGDLVGLWFVLLLAQHFVPVSSQLSRDDLQPWMALALSGVALLRGRPLGMGPHPRLTRRSTWYSGYAFKGLLAVVPWLLLAVQDAAISGDVGKVGQAMGLGVGAAVLLGVSQVHERTPWNPYEGRGRGIVLWAFGVLGLLGVTVAAGVAQGVLADNLWAVAGGSAVVLGVSFLGVGLVGGRSQHDRQRFLSGRKDNEPHRRSLFPIVLAFVGPSVGLFVLRIVLPDLDFAFAFVLALLVVVWGAVIWPLPEPVALACLLHELHPVGGNDTPREATAKPFHLPPDGALRFNPLRTKRTRVVHTWYVPVRASRIADLDDPIRPLWPEPAEAAGHHILGDAAFEPDPLTKTPQWDVCTVRIKSQEDTTSLKRSGDAKTRRMVILRPHVGGTFGQRGQLRTYRWDAAVPEESVQVLDATTQAATLRDGDVIVLSSEGVAHAYEFEVGGPVYWDKSALGARPPQLPDYVKS